MHSWADIEHKLAYKKQEQIPTEFRRKLYQLSALLEIADSQFQDLKNEKEKLKHSLVIEERGIRKFDITKELNIDTFKGYLDFTFPNRLILKDQTTKLFDEFIEFEVTLEQFEKMRIETEEIMPIIESEILSDNKKWAQVGIVRAILDLKLDKYWESRMHIEYNWNDVIREWREKLKQ
jgi:putative GTP pyrophosphokinase